MPYDLSKLAVWCIALTWMFVATAVVSLAHTIWELGLGYGVINAAYDFDPDGGYFEKAYWAIGVFTVLTLIINGIWIYRATAKADSIDPNRDAISPGWSVGWYLIPIANLWMPFLSMRETWASSMGADVQSPTPGLLKIWWAAWVVSLIINGVGDRLALRAVTYEDWVRLQWYYVPVHFLDIIAGIAFAMIIGRVSKALADNNRAAEIFA